MHHFLRLDDFSGDELIAVLDRADELQKDWTNRSMPKSLAGERIALWFYGNGFRNRLAFELGIQAMGGEYAYVPGELGANEPIEDVGHYLENWFSMIVVRAKEHRMVTLLSEGLHIPVVNARTDFNHPCEIVGDLQYIRGRRSSLEELRVVFVGEVSNLCMSWFEAARQLPISITQVAPEGFTLAPDMLKALNTGAVGRIETSSDLFACVSSKTDVLYTDCWPKNRDDRDIETEFTPYQVNRRVLEEMNPRGCFLPCPPVTRGEEVSAEAMASPLCQNYAAKACLLHAQNALMERCLS